ncbi:uncharacterized protein LOC134770190 [Penaeus indicus]|uniref:uncharacterized protein LOC134770190 n=1 Tax=Penaeus indicus TaxID=29960 RepID=UPI00300CC4C4
MAVLSEEIFLIAEKSGNDRPRIMNPLSFRGASVLILVCVVSAAPQGYGSGGDDGLGVDLRGSGVGGGSVLPGVFVGTGVLPESAFGGVAGGVSGGAAGGVIGEEYSAPGAGAAGGFDAGVAGGFDTGVTGGFDTGVVGGFDTGVAGGFDTGVAGGFDTGVAGGFDTGVAAGFDTGVAGSFDTGAVSDEYSAPGVDAAPVGAVDTGLVSGNTIPQDAIRSLPGQAAPADEYVGPAH